MRSTLPFDKPKQFVPVKNPLATMTMAPSSTQMRDSVSDAVEAVGSADTVSPTPHVEEPLLYLMPSELHPTYRPLPVFVQFVVVLLSAWASAVTTWKHLTFIQPLAVVRGLRSSPSLGKMFAFFGKTILFALVAHLSLQDIFLPPSRITIADLCRKYHLPSAISKYEKLHVPDKEGTSAQIGVHYLKYSRDETKGPPLLDAVYVHHGFGASSLSWLPALPSLVHRLGARVGLGHDMVGFGLTDRQNTLEWYTTDASARISSAVFVKETDHVNPVKAVALLGHSLGAIGVLKMALQLPKETFKSIILCSPALGFGSSFAKEWKEEEQAPGPLRDLGRVLGSFFRRCIFFPFGGYALRRIVGLKNSWRQGLKGAVWGNPDSVRDSDVLRYQWPSIGKGWERGLLKFASAQRRYDDHALLQQVLDLPNTTVAIVIGSRDRVISPEITLKFLSDFQDYNLNVVQLQNMGHNSFEEDVETFITTVEKILMVKKE